MNNLFNFVVLLAAIAFSPVCAQYRKAQCYLDLASHVAVSDDACLACNNVLTTYDRLYECGECLKRELHYTTAEEYVEHNMQAFLEGLSKCFMDAIQRCAIFRYTTCYALVVFDSSRHASDEYRRAAATRVATVLKQLGYALNESDVDWTIGFYVSLGHAPGSSHLAIATGSDNNK